MQLMAPVGSNWGTQRVRKFSKGRKRQDQGSLPELHIPTDPSAGGRSRIFEEALKRSYLDYSFYLPRV